jgi:hypothetical protein
MAKNKDKRTQERIEKLLKTVADHFDEEDRTVRERQLRDWRELKLLWEGFTRIWYSEVAHDWRIYDESTANDDSDQQSYDKPINIFRAYLESIIAALSITVPGIKCFPDDAENPLDSMTAKAGDKISLLIYRHNNAPLLWLHALYVLATEGMVACYSYPREDAKYGTYDVPEYEDVEEEAYVCPVCNQRLADDVLSAQIQDEFMPDEEDALLHEVIQSQGPVCPECAALLDPNLQKSKLIVTKQVGVTKKPKSRMCLEVYGGLYVKIPNYAMRQEDMPYLTFSYETHYTNATNRYPDLRKKFSPGGKSGTAAGGMYDPYEQWARLSPQYRGEYPINNVTVRNCWLRPSAFEVLNDEEDVEFLKKEFPDGAKVILVNDTYADCENESLDDCWTIMSDPMSDYLHKRPMGSLLVNVQEITSTIISLALQTIEHGISQTFADPGVLDFEAYATTEVLPGGVYPAIAKTGKALGEGFFETRTATLSQEVLPFFQQVQSLGQMASGALPSLFGGQMDGSKTASEYSMSRAQALQRLQNQWKMITMWWKDIFGKVIPMYVKEIKTDEHSVEKDQQGNFINVFVRVAELEGKIGRVELEANENLPLTWTQRKDVYMKLLETQNPQILEALLAPENIKNLSEAIGLDDFYIPGSDSREKQYEEIKVLINSTPIPQPPSDEDLLGVIEQGGDPEQVPPTEVPSVEIDFDLDNHQIESDICRTYLTSSAGRLLKQENPEGYKNVLLHMKSHLMAQQEKMMQEAQTQMLTQPQTDNPKLAEKPAKSNKPLAENDNVATRS